MAKRIQKKKSLKVVPEIQICTEGKTEALYIMGFLRERGLEGLVRVNCPKVNAGCGRSHLALCEKAHECFKKTSSLRKCYVVFDYDEAETNSAAYKNFCRAVYFGNCNEDTFSIFSIPNFELWLTLHLHYATNSSDKDTSTKTFKRNINIIRSEKKLPRYTKDQHKTDSGLYDLLKPYTENAKNNAKKLVESHGIDFKKLKTYNLDKLNAMLRTVSPITNMHELIDILEEENKDKPCEGKSI